MLKTRTTEIRTERVEVQDPQTGQVRVYGSLDEVPADIRAKIEQARSTAQQSAHTKITVKDASVRTRTYDYVVAVATVFYSSRALGRAQMTDLDRLGLALVGFMVAVIVAGVLLGLIGRFIKSGKS